MPVDALENLMIDAIEAELAKIGTPPTSDWLTTTPPAIKVGVPGDKPPGPNLMTIYLQHVGTTESDSAGTGLHQLRCTFHIWVCSSHAADGQRRALSLLQDIRQALYAGEPAFVEQFPYGSSIGAYAFSGDDARIRSGQTIGHLEFSLTGELPHEDDMTEEQVNALIESYFNKRAFLWNSFANVPTVLRRSAGITESAAKGCLHVLVGTPGANKIAEYGLFGFHNDEPFELRAGHVQGFKRRLGCFVGAYPYGGSGGAPFFLNANAFAGIEIGSFESVPPFSANPDFGIAQLRFVGTPDGRIEFLTAKSGGEPVIVRAYDLAPMNPHGALLEFEVDPVAQTIAAYADNVLLGISDPADYPDFAAGGDGTHFGIFMTSGTNAGGSPECWFSNAFHRMVYA